MYRALILWLLGSSPLLCAQSKELGCRSFTVTGELAAKASFERIIGNGLSFQMKPTMLGANGQLNGWEIYIAQPGHVEHDYIYPVNFPLRFNGVQILGTSYNDDAKASLERPHEMWFMTNKTDYDKVLPVLNNALWPYMSPHPDKVGEEFSAVLKTVETGWLEVTVLNYDLAPDQDSIQRIKFQIQFIVPRSFKLPAGLSSGKAACHARSQ